MPKPDLHLERIRELIAIMDETGVSELSVELPELKISLKREVGAAALPEPAAGEAAGGPAAIPTRGSAAASAQGGLSSPMLVPVAAPMVGTFRAAAEGGRKLAPGDAVASGQAVGAIEAMKVPNEIAAPVSGIVREVLAADGAPVEYGQPLMLIEPLAAPEGAEVEAEAL